MFFYCCLIYAHYRRNPVALAVVTSGHRKDERFYSHLHFGTKIVYDYNNLVLAELDEGELRESDNPIDLALYAAKCALKAKKETHKFNYLRTLLKLLAERGWDSEDKRDLLLFLERIIDLRDKELEKQYIEYRNQLSKEGKIVYIPLGERELAREIEQRGMEKGMEKGKEEMAREMARNLLANGISPDIIAKSAGMPVEQIRSLVN
jgi:predicted transposase YdaD